MCRSNVDVKEHEEVVVERISDTHAQHKRERQARARLKNNMKEWNSLAHLNDFIRFICMDRLG